MLTIAIIHDLAKFMFGMSIFLDLFMVLPIYVVIWYSNIPEEVTYFVTRIADFNLPVFWHGGPLNFFIPCTFGYIE